MAILLLPLLIWFLIVQDKEHRERDEHRKKMWALQELPKLYDWYDKGMMSKENYKKAHEHLQNILNKN